MSQGPTRNRWGHSGKVAKGSINVWRQEQGKQTQGSKTPYLLQKWGDSPKPEGMGME